MAAAIPPIQRRRSGRARAAPVGEAAAYRDALQERTRERVRLSQKDDHRPVTVELHSSERQKP
jgi:hypothetical protein